MFLLATVPVFLINVQGLTSRSESRTTTHRLKTNVSSTAIFLDFSLPYCRNITFKKNSSHLGIFTAGYIFVYSCVFPSPVSMQIIPYNSHVIHFMYICVTDNLIDILQVQKNQPHFQMISHAFNMTEGSSYEILAHWGGAVKHLKQSWWRIAKFFLGFPSSFQVSSLILFDRKDRTRKKVDKTQTRKRHAKMCLF